MKNIVQGVSPRLLGTGLLSSSANSSGVRITGVIAQNERAVSAEYLSVWLKAPT